MPERRNFRFHSERSGTALTVQVVPGARKSRISQIRSDGCLVVNLKHEASDERCNQFLLEFLAEVLSVEQNQLDIVAGAPGEYKVVSILGMSSDRADELLRARVKK